MNFLNISLLKSCAHGSLLTTLSDTEGGSLKSDPGDVSPDLTQQETIDWRLQDLFSFLYLFFLGGGVDLTVFHHGEKLHNMPTSMNVT